MSQRTPKSSAKISSHIPSSENQKLNQKNRIMLKSAIDIAKKTKSKKLFIYFDAFDSQFSPENLPSDVDVVLVTKNRELKITDSLPHASFVTLPNLTLGRMGLVKLSVLLAMSAKLVHPDDNIVFLSGSSKNGQLDFVLCLTLDEESELLTGHSIAQIPDTISPEVFELALNLAIELASKGREGKPVGTIFVLGDEEKVMQLSKQMIINPFKGYDANERNLLNPALKETIREFSSLDGSFVVSGNGEVLTAGRYLGAAMDGAELPRGLGSRHIAASGITALTNAIAIVISESTGDVRIFKGGHVIMTIEKSSR